MRVHELAKTLGMSSKELMDRIRENGGEVKNHMSIVNVELLQLIQGKLHKKAPDAMAKDEGGQEGSGSAEAGSSSGDTARASERASSGSREAVQEAEGEIRKVRFPITVGALAGELKITIPDMIKALMSIGVFANVNQLLNEEIGLALAEKLEIEIEPQESVVAAVLQREEEDPAKLQPRPTVVTMMGHVDHGKTSLLDAIRKTNVAGREKGAITQHIGAYNVKIPGKDGRVTFLDTPGHEAFTAMRARGANVTDVVVLVVAADDGVMPQTIEAVDHAREAGCPIVVAINKCDLPGADPARVMKGLQKIDLTPEEWGGKTVCVKVSAKTGEGIDELLELLMLEAEILELKANPDAMAEGVVIEGHLSRGAGPVASVIVRRGTLRVGDVVVCGCQMGRIRSLRNDLGKNMKEAGPSFAAEVAGLNGVPEAGEVIVAVEDEKTARVITDQRVLERREREMSGAAKHLSLEDLYHRISEGNFKELKLIIKADVQGSLEALKQSLEKISSEKCVVRVIHGGMGAVNESDVMLAAASDAVIMAFHVKPDQKAQTLSAKEGVDIRSYHIIYDAVESIRLAMEGLLAPEYNEVFEGKVELRKIFRSSKAGTIGGGMVIKGQVKRTNPVRVIRDNIIVHEGKLGALKRFKDDVREVQEGYECGVSFQKFNDLREGDIIESYRIDKVAAKL